MDAYLCICMSILPFAQVHQDSSTPQYGLVLRGVEQMIRVAENICHEIINRMGR